MVYHCVTPCLNRAISKGALYLLTYRPNCLLVIATLGDSKQVALPGAPFDHLS